MRMSLRQLFNSLPSDLKNKINEKIPVNQIIKDKTPNLMKTRFPVILVLDSSGSMAGSRMNEINSGLTYLRLGLQGYRDGQALVTDYIEGSNLPLSKLDLAVIQFDSDVQVIQPFSKIETFQPPKLIAQGTTSMGKAIMKAIEITKTQKQLYQSLDVDWYRPWIFLVTDGEPTDMKQGDSLWNLVTRSIQNGEENKDFMFFSVGVGETNFQFLKSISPKNRPPLKLKEGSIHNMFTWLGKSFEQVTSSPPNTKVNLEDPTGPNGWASIIS
jgi:uncharacterized protein YegL